MVINGRRIAWRPKVLTNTNSIMGRATTASSPQPGACPPERQPLLGNQEKQERQHENRQEEIRRPIGIRRQAKHAAAGQKGRQPVVLQADHQEQHPEQKQVGKQVGLQGPAAFQNMPWADRQQG